MTSTCYYYDAHSKCIKYSSRLIGEDGTVALLGCEIVDIRGGDDDDSKGDNKNNLPPGKIFMGEITDIIVDHPSGKHKDFGQHSEPALQSKIFHYLDPDNTTTDPRGWSTEQILQRHRQLQTVHATQHQRLLHKHMKDWKWCHTNNLSVERIMEMQGIHQRESIELQSRQQREQSNILDFILFTWLPMNYNKTEGVTRSSSSSSSSSSTHSTDAAKLITMPVLPAGENSKTKIDANPPSVESDSIAAPHVGKDRTPSLLDPPSLPDRILIDRQKADEIKAVMRDRSLSQNERRRKLAEIRQKYITGNVVGMATTTLPSHRSSNTNDTSNEHTRQIELQAIMRDPSLSREVKLKRIVLINAKYSQDVTNTTQNEVKGEIQSQSMQVSSRENNGTSKVDYDDVDKDAMAGTDGDGEDEYDQSVNSGSQSLETNRSSGSPQSSHFLTSSSTSSSSSSSSSSLVESMGPESESEQEDDTKRGGGGIQVKQTSANIDATGTVTANVPNNSQTAKKTVDGDVLKSSSSKEATNRIEATVTRLSTSHLVGSGLRNGSSLPDKPKDSGNAVDNKAVDVATSEAATKVVKNAVPDDPFHGIPTDRTPIKKLIEKLNDDDPSLTVLKLDGRTQIKANDWMSFFQSLESNSTLTHLSVSRCELNDEVAIALVLAMVVNESIVGLRLNHNEGLTDETGKGFIKVLRQSNSTIKILEVSRTKITTKLTQKLNKLLEERDAEKSNKQHHEKVKSPNKSEKVLEAVANGKDNESKQRRRSLFAVAKSVTTLTRRRESHA